MLIAVSATALVALAVISTAAANPDIDAKKAHAREVYNQYLDLAMATDRVSEEVNGARLKLASIETELGVNTQHLGVARRSLTIAQTRIATRLRAIYIEGESGGAVEVILGARSLDDMLGRIDMVQRVGSQDSRVLGEVRKFRTEVEERRAKLRSDRAEQARLVAEIKAKQQELLQRRDAAARLYESEKADIARLEAEEARRAAAAAAAAEVQRREAAAAAARAQAAAEAQNKVATASTDPGDGASGDGSSTQGLPAAPDLSATAPAPAVVAPPDTRYSGVVAIAMQYLGVPYVWGGMSPSGFDCSGLISYVYAQVGVSLPHYAAAQWNYGTPVSRDDLQAGDLVFFDGLGHAGIYVGGGSFIHAPHTGDVVKISSIYQDWYASNWVGARRLT